MAINKDLFEKVKNHILEEPRRYNQARYGKRSDEAPCGTACCIAGWAIILDRQATPDDAQQNFFNVDALLTGAKALGLSVSDAQVVFDGGAMGWPEPFRSEFAQADFAEDKAGQAKAAAAYIDYIIKTGSVT